MGAGIVDKPLSIVVCAHFGASSDRTVLTSGTWAMELLRGSQEHALSTNPGTTRHATLAHHPETRKEPSASGFSDWRLISPPVPVILGSRAPSLSGRHTMSDRPASVPASRSPDLRVRKFRHILLWPVQLSL